MGLDTAAVITGSRVEGMRVKRVASWALFSLAMIVLFVLWLFPYDRLQTWVLHQWHTSTGLTLSTGPWQFVWPLGASADSAALTGPGLPRFEAERVTVRLKPSSLWQPGPSLTGTARLRSTGAGETTTLTGDLTFDAWSWSDSASLTATVDRVDLSKLAVPGLTSGSLRLMAEHRWSKVGNPRDFIQGEGTWHLEGAGVTLEQVPVGGATLPLVRISTLQARLKCRSGTCRLEQAQGEGPDGTLSGDGMLALRLPVSDSILDGTFTVSLTRPTSLSFRAKVTGPLSNLKWSW